MLLRRIASAAARTFFRDSDTGSELEREVRKALTLGVQYVYLADVEGDIMEAGTMTGRTARAIAAAMVAFDERVDAARRKRLHMFDSFKGLPPASLPVDAESFHVKSGVWGAGTHVGLSKEQLLELCRRQRLGTHRIRIYDGFFKETMERIERGTVFSMLHIDCDLYESAMDVLDFCFSNAMVAEGAVIFFDDYNANRASPRFGERQAWAEIVDRFSVQSSDCGEYGWCGWKFIVHGYGRKPS